MIECAHCPAVDHETECQGWTFIAVTLAPIASTVPTPPETLAREALCPVCTTRARAMLKDPAYVPPEADN